MLLRDTSVASDVHSAFIHSNEAGTFKPMFIVSDRVIVLEPGLA
jgi:hypothetical protein